MAKLRVVRGASLFVTIVFLDENEQPVGNLSGATLRLAYTVNGARQTQEIAMSDGGAGQWLATWDTSPADEGALFWWAHSAGSPKSACQGQLIIEANPANPQVS